MERMEHLPTSPDDKESDLIREIKEERAYEIYRSIWEDYDDDKTREDDDYYNEAFLY